MVSENNFNYYTDFFIEELVKTFVRKFKSLNRIEEQEGKKLDKEDILENIETIFKGSFYMYVRYLYNNYKEYNIGQEIYSALFFFLREYSYSGMFRFNNKGEFNVPYGGNSYNKKDFRKKVNYLKNKKLIEKLNNTEIFNLDFEKFLDKTKPQKNDFLFLDPPYDTEFSTYDKNSFNKNDQERLANYLIDNCNAKWMLIIKNTEFIYNLYNKPGTKIQSFDKKYLVNFKNRNNKDVKHLIITNY